jgi:hypothetical protein
MAGDGRMKNTYYVVMRIQRSINVDGVTATFPKGKGFLPVFDTKEAAEEYAAPFTEIIEVESRDEVEREE